MYLTKKHLPLALIFLLVISLSALVGYMGTRTYLRSDTLTGTKDSLSYNEIIAKITDIKNRMPWAEEQITRTEDEIRTIESYIVQEQASLKKYNASIVENQKQLNVLTPTINSLESLIKTQTARITTFTQQIAKAKGSTKTQLNNQKKALETKNNKDKLSLKTFLTKKTSFQNSLTSAQNEFNYLENLIKNRKQEKLAQEQLLSSLISELSALKSELQLLENQLTTTCPDPTQVWDTATGTCITDESVDTGGDDAFDELDESIPDYIMPAIPVTEEIFDQYTFTYDAPDDETMFQKQISEALRDLRANPGTTLDLSFMPDDQVSEQEKADFPIKYEREGVVYKLVYTYYRNQVSEGPEGIDVLASSTISSQPSNKIGSLQKSKYQRWEKLYKQMTEGKSFCSLVSWSNLIRDSGCFLKWSAGYPDESEKDSRIIKFLSDAVLSDKRDVTKGLLPEEIARWMNQDRFSWCRVIEDVQELCNNNLTYNRQYCMLELNDEKNGKNGHAENLVRLDKKYDGTCIYHTDDTTMSNSTDLHTWWPGWIISIEKKTEKSKPKDEKQKFIDEQLKRIKPISAICCESACSGDKKSMQ